MPLLRSLIAGVALVSACATPGPRFGSLDSSVRNLHVSSDLRLLGLSNGMTVLLAPDRRTNLVTVDVRYPVGSARDPEGRIGLAHLVEHLTFQAASGSRGGTIFDRLSSLALTFNAYTTPEYTHYTATALAERVDALLELEAERLASPCADLSPALVLRERDVVLAEESERRTDLTDARREIDGEVWGPKHPYARGVGSRQVAGATKAEVCKFIDDNYLPQGAIIVVSGNFDADALGPRIGRRFGPIERPAPGGLVPGISGPHLTGTRSHHTAAVDHPIVNIYLAAPPQESAGAAVHDMIVSALASKLAQLDRSRDWVLDADVTYTGQGVQRATLVSVTIDDAKHVDDAIEAVFERGHGLFQDDDRDGVADDNDDPDDADVTRLIAAYRGGLQTRLITRLDAIDGRGDWLADYLTYTTENQFAAGTMQALDEVTGRALVAHAAELFDKHRVHVAVIEPSGDVASAPAEEATGERSYDLQPWRLEIDPAEAAHPLALPRGLPPLQIDDYKLTNGLRVLLYADPTSPIVDARLVYPAGRLDEGPDHPGVATIAATLLDHDFDRTYPRRTVDLLNWAFGLGTRLDTDVRETATVFSAGGLAVFADWHVWRLSWLLDQGVYAPDDLKAMRQGLRENGDGEVSPSGVVYREKLYGRGHPYAAPSATVAQLAAVTPSQLARWRSTRFVPGGATLIISGGIDPAVMHKVVGELFGPWSKREAPPHAPVPPPHPAAGPSWLGVRIASAAQVKLYVAFAAASNSHDDRAARMVLTEMLSDRLRMVREGLGASYGVSAFYKSGAAGSALFIGTALDPVRAPEAARAVMTELAALHGDAGTRASDFARARRRVLAELLATSRDAATMADNLEGMVVAGQTIDQLADLPAAVAALTPDAVAQVAAADLDPARMVVSVDGRPDRITATLTALGATDPQWFDE